MTTLTTTEVEHEFAIELDSLDTSMDRLYAHYVYPQQGAYTAEEIMALPVIVALCGYTFRHRKRYDLNNPLTCPRCHSIYQDTP